MKIRKDWAILVIIMLALAALACNLPGGGDASGSGPAEGLDVPAATYAGLGLDLLPYYDANLVVTFTPNGGNPPPWSYESDLRGDGGSTLRTFKLDGVSGSQNPGQLTLTRIGKQQYLNGPGVSTYFESATCLITPIDLGQEAAVDLDESFLTPDDFLTPANLNASLTPDGEDTIAGVDGWKYRIDGAQAGPVSNVRGTLVLAKEGGYALRYNLEGEMVDGRFTDARGKITWRYHISSVRQGERISVPVECIPPYPITADAFGVTWLGDVLAFGSATARGDITAFYQTALVDQGWQEAAAPEVTSTTTTLTFTDSGGRVLLVIIRDEEIGTSVTIALQ